MEITSREYHAGYEQGYLDAKQEMSETYSKSNMVDMLTMIYEEISSVKTADIGEVIVKGECKNVIQKKIHSLALDLQKE